MVELVTMDNILLLPLSRRRKTAQVWNASMYTDVRIISLLYIVPIAELLSPSGKSHEPVSHLNCNAMSGKLQIFLQELIILKVYGPLNGILSQL